MYIDFEKMPSNTRVWVYLANKTLNDTEKNQIGDFLKPNMQSWAAHGEALYGGYAFIENTFLIIAVDQQAHMPSGCSIDASTRWIKEIHERFGVDFLTRAIVVKNQDSVQSLPVFQIKKHIEEGLIAADSLIYDQQVSTKAELEESFLKPASHVFSRYFLEKV